MVVVDEEAAVVAGGGAQLLEGDAVRQRVVGADLLFNGVAVAVGLGPAAVAFDGAVGCFGQRDGDDHSWCSLMTARAMSAHAANQA